MVVGVWLCSRVVWVWLCGCVVVVMWLWLKGACEAVRKGMRSKIAVPARLTRRETAGEKGERKDRRAGGIRVAPRSQLRTCSMSSRVLSHSHVKFNQIEPATRVRFYENNRFQNKPE